MAQDTQDTHDTQSTQNTYFFTGFPGFIATQIIERLLHEYPNSQFVLLVHPSQLDKAKVEASRITKDFPESSDAFHLMTGDITIPKFGLSDEALKTLQTTVTHVFHLAAIYDLAVPQTIANAVNVIGTKHVNEFVLQLQRLERYVYFSTAYVSGRRKGRVLEDELECGQTFKNFYESTKYEAEVLVQRIRNNVPVTIIRPGIVMGNSNTGKTVKFDGPYFAMRFLDKMARFPIPYLGRGDAEFNLVPIDYVVGAVCFLAHDERGRGKVYHLTDPHPYPARDAYRFISVALTGKTPSYTLPPWLVSAFLSVPAFRRYVMVEKETVEYFQLEATYDCSNATRDLASSEIRCPDFADYIPVAVRFYEEHRHDRDKRILVK